MNDRAGAGGRKTKPPPAVRYLRREGRAPATHSPGARRRSRRQGLRLGTGPRGGRAPPQSTGPAARRPPAGPRAPRGKQAAGGAAARRMQLPAAGAAAKGPRDPALPSPTPRPEAATGETRRRSRARPARPARPSATLPAALRSGLGLRSPLCWHLPSLPATLGAPPAAPRRRPPPGYAAPPARPADCVESARAAAGTREAMSPARAREGAGGPGAARRFTAELGGPGWRGASPRDSATFGSLALALLASPASSAPARRRLPSRCSPPPSPASLPPPPSSCWAGPGARPNQPLRPGPPRAQGRPAHLWRRRRPSR